MAPPSSRWTDRELELFVERMHEFWEEDKAWKTKVREDLDSLLLQREQIRGAKILLYWVGLGLAGLASIWTFVTHEFSQFFK